MKKFLAVYLAPISPEQQMQNASPEDMRKGMEPWMAWFQNCGSAIVDGGAPLIHGLKVTPSGATPAQSHVCGYSILQAEDLDAVKALLGNHPHFLMPGGEIELFEAMPMAM